MELGEKRKGMNMAYPSASDKDEAPEIIHQTVSLPLKILDGKKVKKGDYICITLEGTITGIHDDEYSSSFTMKAEEGSCEENDESGDEDNGTYLGGKEKEE